MRAIWMKNTIDMIKKSVLNSDAKVPRKLNKRYLFTLLINKP
ncbi:hypothetical protein ATCC51562_1742 [Campylobacter concisus ATCC 51562]|uniref:Uncharacterized protein n=1 Tax=Campylobacter concisus ATCC 51562 TaxID=1242969 RepID=U2GIE1_9BACT|nr:hypothetical protein ATCC51562_1742 [Campylobacter concisus ATCC 51562]